MTRGPSSARAFIWGPLVLSVILLVVATPLLWRFVKTPARETFAPDGASFSNSRVWTDSVGRPWAYRTTIPASDSATEAAQAVWSVLTTDTEYLRGLVWRARLGHHPSREVFAEAMRGPRPTDKELSDLIRTGAFRLDAVVPLYRPDLALRSGPIWSRLRTNGEYQAFVTMRGAPAVTFTLRRNAVRQTWEYNQNSAFNAFEWLDPDTRASHIGSETIEMRLVPAQWVSWIVCRSASGAEWAVPGEDAVVPQEQPWSVDGIGALSPGTRYPADCVTRPLTRPILVGH